MAEDTGELPSTQLVAVTTDTATSNQMLQWLAPALAVGARHAHVGFYSAIEAVERGVDIVVMNVGVPSGRDVWRLAEVRARARSATVLVVADATQMPILSGPLRPDLVATSVDALPPLRELLVGHTPSVDVDQTIRRRSTR